MNRRISEICMVYPTRNVTKQPRQHRHRARCSSTTFQRCVRFGNLQSRCCTDKGFVPAETNYFSATHPRSAMTDSNDNDKPQESAAPVPDRKTSSSSSSSSFWPIPKLHLPEIPDVRTQITEFPKRVSEMKIPTHWEEPLESGTFTFCCSPYCVAGIWSTMSSHLTHETVSFDHPFVGVIKAVIGATVGGAVGMLLFKSGSGWRSACMAVGVGAAVGNTYERLVKASADAATGSPPK